MTRVPLSCGRFARDFPPSHLGLHSLADLFVFCGRKKHTGNPCPSAGPISIGLECVQLCDGLNQPLSVGPESPRANIPMLSVRVCSPLFTLFLLLPLPSCPRKNFPRNRMIRCLELLRSILCPLLPRPFTLAQKKTVLCSTQKHALSWKVPEKSSILGCQFGFSLVAEFSDGQFGFFSPFSYPP